MKRTVRYCGIIASLALARGLTCGGLFGPAWESQIQADSDAPADKVDRPATVNEARGRAQLLHEAMHGALLVMHRDFFLEDESVTIPSRSLEDVFKELADGFDVKLRWLAVNAQAMNVDNKPQDDFERQAVKELATGKKSFEQTADGVFRYAGTIRLASECLKCHLPSRTSNKDRTAGLVISIPLSGQ